MSFLTYFFTFSTATVEPPTSSQLRFNADIANGTSKLWVRNLTNDGVDVRRVLLALPVGTMLDVQDKNDSTQIVQFEQTGAPIDKVSYVELPVTWVHDAAPLSNNQPVMLLCIVPDAVVPGPPGPPGPAGATALPSTSSTPTAIRSMLALPIDPEPLTLDEGKLRAGLDWIAGDERDALMLGFISAARAQVEQDTGLAIPEQSRDLFFDALPTFIAWRALPSQSTPLQRITTVSWLDSAGTVMVLDPTAYTVTISNAGVTLTVAAPPADAQRWIVRIVAGFVPPLPPSLLQAVGVLTGHYATVGRDVSIDERRIGLTPLGYAEAIRAWTIEVLP
jgi:uncharacterized phiE125 gp8 family phage protein